MEEVEIIETEENEIFRVHKNGNFTAVCNYHLRDKRISLKAKGILTQMLSLPKNLEILLQRTFKDKQGRRGGHS